jgi:ankyrin repeat protein
VELVTLLVNHGADLRARDLLGRTPLHSAAAAGSTQAAAVLVQLGADVEASDSHLSGEHPAAGDGTTGLNERFPSPFNRPDSIGKDAHSAELLRLPHQQEGVGGQGTHPPDHNPARSS